jgi:hypothetical protein
MPTKVSEAEFLQAWNLYQSPIKVAKALGLGLRTVYARRERLEQRHGQAMKTIEDPRRKRGITSEKRVAIEELGDTRFTHLEQAAKTEVQDGTVVVFSDAHYWPGEPSAAHLALVAIIERLRPQLVVANGDLFDGARTSRHPRAGWEQRPSVAEEVEVVCLRMREVEKAAKRFENFDEAMFRTTNGRVVEYQAKINEVNDRFTAALNAEDMAELAAAEAAPAKARRGRKKTA